MDTTSGPVLDPDALTTDEEALAAMNALAQEEPTGPLGEESADQTPAPLPIDSEEV